VVVKIAGCPLGSDTAKGATRRIVDDNVGLIWLVAAYSQLEAGADGEGQAGISDGADVLLAEEIFQLSKDRDVTGYGVGDVEIEFGIAEVEIAVGEKERVAKVGVKAVEEGRVVGTAGESAFEGCGEFVSGVLDSKEASVRRTAEGTGSDEGTLRSDRNAGQVGVGCGGTGIGVDGIVGE
jgi:hypothetical protein